MIHQKLVLLVGCLTICAGCQTPRCRQQPVAQAPAPLPFHYDSTTTNDNGAYFKETYTREGGRHNKDKLTSSGGNPTGGNGIDNCPPGTIMEGGQSAPQPTVNPSPLGTFPSGPAIKPPTPTIPVPPRN